MLSPMEPYGLMVSTGSVFTGPGLKLKFSVMAPVGQVEIHRPQDSQLVSVSDSPRAGATKVSNPRSTRPRAFAPTTSLQMRTQREHRIHLLLSISTYGWEKSTGLSIN